MSWLLAAIGVWLAGGVGALLFASSAAWATRIGVASVVLGSLAGMVPVLSTLFGGPVLEFQVAWGVPYGSLSLELDGLSAFFLLPTLVVGTLAAIYGGEYLLSYRNVKILGVPWFLYNWMIAGMAVVFMSRNALLFIMGWELMTLGAVFLVFFDDAKGNVRSAGWIYLVASHIATVFLLVLFIVLGQETGTLDFAGFAASSRSAWLSGFLFVYAVVGFGTKAGIMPFHIWLPEAHPAAPSHVSAVMSALILKTGVYGLLRALTFLGDYQEWWGWLLMGIGLTSALLGILFALAQSDLKRLLAYSSVENIGIIFIGIGMGVLGVSRGSTVLATLGFCGALLHVLNHSIAKGMLFLNAGCILHATGTRRINLLGGLSKRMPWEGGTFLVGALALCALPPLNGFLSEFWIYLGAYRMRGISGSGVVMPSLVLLAGLALVGGFAAVAFSKAFGSAYLGQPRLPDPQPFHRPGWAMRGPLLALAAICILLVPALPWAATLTIPMVEKLTGLDGREIHEQIASVQASLWPLAIFAGFLFALAGALAGIRWAVLRGRKIGAGPTWGCGYAAPTRRMQYTGTSFSQPLAGFFSLILQGRKTEEKVDGIFPRSASHASSIPDLYLEKIYRPLFQRIDAWLVRWRWIQHGRIQAYILYISLTLLFLLTWKLW